MENTLDRKSTGETLSSYGSILTEIVTSFKKLIQSELKLLSAEIKDHIEKAKTQSKQMAFGLVCMVLGAFALLSFMIIGLGEVLEGRYWLSSLVVAGVLGTVGSVLAFRSMKKIQKEALNLKEARAETTHGIQVVQRKVQDVKIHTTGETYGQAAVY